MRISFITTLLNEGSSIDILLDSLNRQSVLPDEIIIVDGGSSDDTIKKIINFQKSSNNRLKIKLITKKGNRSVGRNTSIRNATGDIVACSDAGCVLDKNWVKNITKPFDDKKVDVVAGYYKGRATSVFQKCLIPYVLVMPDKVDPNNFLPATRSVAFRRKVWDQTGGFNEKLSHNEDYEYAKKLKGNKYNIFFQKSAIVYWYPPNTFKKAFVMFFRFAYGDSEAGIFRPKVVLILLRYIIGVLLFSLAIIKGSEIILASLIAASLLYILWSISKNYRNVQDKRGMIILPILQFISDISVISGTILGLIKHGL